MRSLTVEIRGSRILGCSYCSRKQVPLVRALPYSLHISTYPSRFLLGMTHIGGNKAYSNPHSSFILSYTTFVYSFVSHLHCTHYSFSFKSTAVQQTLNGRSNSLLQAISQSASHPFHPSTPHLHTSAHLTPHISRKYRTYRMRAVA